MVIIINTAGTRLGCINVLPRKHINRLPMMIMMKKKKCLSGQHVLREDQAMDQESTPILFDVFVDLILAFWDLFHSRLL